MRWLRMRHGEHKHIRKEREGHMFHFHALCDIVVGEGVAVVENFRAIAAIHRLLAGPFTRGAWVIAMVGCTTIEQPPRRELAGLRTSTRIEIDVSPPSLAINFEEPDCASLSRNSKATVDGMPIPLIDSRIEAYGNCVPAFGLTYAARARSPMTIVIEDPSDVWTIVLDGLGPDDIELGPLAPGQPSTILWRTGPPIDSGDFALWDATGKWFEVPNNEFRVDGNTIGIDVPTGVAVGAAKVQLYLTGEYYLNGLDEVGARAIGSHTAPTCDGPVSCNVHARRFSQSIASIDE
jgi:hypothetical protein